MDIPQPETHDDAFKRRIRMVVALFATAVQNVPLNSSATRAQDDPVEKIHDAIQSVFQDTPRLEFSESGNHLVVGDRFFEKQDPEMPKIEEFLSVLNRQQIRRLVFEKGMDIDELKAFVDMLRFSPEDSETATLIEGLCGSEHMPHILVETATDRRPREKSETRDSQNRRAEFGRAEFLTMVQTLNRVLEPQRKDLVARQLAESIAARQKRDRILVLTRKPDTDFGRTLFDNLVHAMDDAAFDETVEEIQAMIAESEEAIRNPRPENPVNSMIAEQEHLKAAVNALRDSRKGAGDGTQTVASGGEEREKSVAENGIQRRKEGIQQILLGNDEPLGDDMVMGAIPEMIGHLYEQKKDPLAERLILRVYQGFQAREPKTQLLAAEILVKIFEVSLRGGHAEGAKKIFSKLSQGITGETYPPFCLEKIFIQLQQLSCALIRENRFSDALCILDFLRDPCRESTDKHSDAGIGAEKALAQAAADNIVDLLVRHLLNSDRDVRDGASAVLIHFGKFCVNRLLGILNESEDKIERIRVLRVITDIGKEALPAIIERIRKDNPWYFTRNLIILLGRVGADDDAKLLEPFFSHEDLRIQGEVITSLLAIGGKHRGPLLLSALEVVDKSLKPNVATLLGALDYAPAVDPLLELLSNRPEDMTDVRADLEEKICLALGRIATPDVIACLEMLSNPMIGASEFRNTPHKVQAAAALAINMIREKWERQTDTSMNTVPPETPEIVPGTFGKGGFDTLSKALDAGRSSSEFVAAPKDEKPFETVMANTLPYASNGNHQELKIIQNGPKIAKHPRLRSSFRIDKKDPLQKALQMPAEPESLSPSKSPAVEISHRSAKPEKRDAFDRIDWKTPFPTSPPEQNKSLEKLRPKAEQSDLVGKVTLIPGSKSVQAPLERRKPPEPTIGLKTKIPGAGMPSSKPKKGS
jgi:HEAT repeat protein